jgi:hypothetical protein
VRLAEEAQESDVLALLNTMQFLLPLGGSKPYFAFGAFLRCAEFLS